MKTFQQLGLLSLLQLFGTNWSSEAAEVFYDFEVSPVLGNDFSPDCQNVQLQRRWLYLAKERGDDSFSDPGPLIEANEGDTVVVRVTNEHSSLSTSIHFHGIHQRGTPWSDGASQITQCPLGPHQTQEYRFEAYPPGTHYWHAHLSLEHADGLTGAIVVHPSEPEPFAYDEERVLFLQDFYSETGPQQAIGLDNLPFTWIGNPDSLLINGHGISPQCQENGINAGNPEVCLDTCVDELPFLSSVSVDSKKTYRIRIINSSQLIMQNVAIAGHKMILVEVEGTILESPIELENYDLAPGQRVSVLVTTDQTPDNYYIETTVRHRDIPELTGRAILQYASVELALPTILPEHPSWDDVDEALRVEDALRTMNASSYEEYVALEADETEVKRWVLAGTQNLLLDEDGEPMQLRWAVNNISNILTPDPLIGRAVRVAGELGWPADLGGTTVDMPNIPPTQWNYTEPVTDEGGPGRALGQQGTAVIRLNDGDVFELVLQNTRALNGVAEFHPWHIHGHSFWMVGRGEGIFDAETDPAGYNTEDPVLRDTATLWPLGWSALRMVANNPGVWFFHCHLASHLHMGMALTVIVEPGMVGDPSDSVAFCDRDALTPTFSATVVSESGTSTSSAGLPHRSTVLSSVTGLVASLALLLLL